MTPKEQAVQGAIGEYWVRLDRVWHTVADVELNEELWLEFTEVAIRDAPVTRSAPLRDAVADEVYQVGGTQLEILSIGPLEGDEIDVVTCVDRREVELVPFGRTSSDVEQPPQEAKAEMRLWLSDEDRAVMIEDVETEEPC